MEQVVPEGGPVTSTWTRSTPEAANRVVAVIARELGVGEHQVRAAVKLLDEGATVPFIARYRKEVTGGLDDTQLRYLHERLEYLRELEERRASILESIASQGKLDESLERQIRAAETKQRLEDLYLPYKPKRRTRAQIAREAGLEPLADLLLADPMRDPGAEALGFVRAGGEGVEFPVPDAKAALDGARDILAERFAEQADVLDALRSMLDEEAEVHSTVVEGKEREGEKFRDYFDHREFLRGIPSHRALALFRGRKQGVLALKLSLPEVRESEAPHPCIRRIAGRVGLSEVYDRDGAPGQRPGDRWLADVLRWCWRVKLMPHFENELFAGARTRAEEEAIRVFGANLKDLLLAPPAGRHAVIGLDPGLRTGVKVAVVDATGKLLETATIYPHEPRRDVAGSLACLADLARRHQVSLVAIGNGTASRETDRLVADLISANSSLGLRKLIVSEAGASVYSASEVAATEFPDLDVSLRGAVSIARRLQDPLAELVRIEPKSIGVGQYQHDVNQRALSRALDGVVEDCVNAVGVDVNTASSELLARVSGLSSTVARRIVAHRESRGAFEDRNALRDVPQLGDKAFEQSAGFLRVAGGSNPLDSSSVHPEAYPVVERILGSVGLSATELIGRGEILSGLRPESFVDERFGLETVRDIIAELLKPGRDPRGEFVVARLRDGVERIEDLQPGMSLQGTVTNVANFGAFVDIGVHQDGLVHVSQLADRFIKDPRDAVRVGQVVTVKVLEVDVERRRIALSMRNGSRPEPGRPREPGRGGGRAASGPRPPIPARRPEPAGTALGAALAMALGEGKKRR